ncbi:MAG: response regulator [Opitutaceae bacterium]
MNAKILIVDDSTLARRMLRNLLEGMGHTVEEATEGAQALERYCVNQPELVILDLVMSGMYGLEVLAKLREIDPAVRVIVSTADIQSSTYAEVREAGAKGILNKPVNKEQLSATLAAVLDGGHSWK